MTTDIQTDTQIENTGTKLLSDKPEAALQDMIKMTRRLVNLAGREAQALATNDLMSFAIMQDEKAVLAERYVEMSRQFRARIEEFRGIDNGILNRLEQIQKDLADATRDTNKEIARVRGYALQATRSTLFTAQEVAQTHQVEFLSQQ